MLDASVAMWAQAQLLGIVKPGMKRLVAMMKKHSHSDSSSSFERRLRQKQYEKGFHLWHATDISFPPCCEGKISTSRAVCELNAKFLRELGVQVDEGADVFDLLTYLHVHEVDYAFRIVPTGIVMHMILLHSTNCRNN